MATEYEWDIETTEDGEIQHAHAEGLYEYTAPDWRDLNEGRLAAALVLVREHDGARCWAYARKVDGLWMLPQYFEDAYGNTGASVPVRFQRELEHESRKAERAARGGAR